MIFQGRELRAPPAAPILSRLQQLPANSAVLMLAPYRDLRNQAVDHWPVHGIGRLIQPRIDESNNFIAELCDKRDAFRAFLSRMLWSFSVTRRYGCKRGQEIQLRIKTGMMLSALKERAGDSVSILCHSRTNGRP